LQQLEKDFWRSLLWACGGFLFIGSILSQFYVVHSADHYLYIHTVLEFISVFVSFAVFTMAWLTRDGLEDRQGRFILCLGLGFFAVGILDFLHAMAYDGMPVLLTPGSEQKASFLWLYGRYVGALTFLAAIFLLEKERLPLVRSAIAGLFFVISIAALALVLSTYYLYLIPPLFTEQYGLTSLKIKLEYGVIALYLLSFKLLWNRRGSIQETISSQLIWYLVFSIFSEAAFISYASVYDTFNMAGSIYKAIAYYFLFRAVYFSGLVDYFYTLSEMAKMSAEFLNDDITLETMLDVQMSKLRKLMPQAERISVYLKKPCDCYRAVYVWGRYSDLLYQGREVHFVNIEEKLGCQLTLIPHPQKLPGQIGTDAYTPEIGVAFLAAHQMLYVPLMAKGTYLGYIFIYTFSRTRSFSHEDLEKSAVFQKFAALAIAQAINREAITRLSYQDTLTGLPNRRRFFEELSKIKYDADQYDIPFTVIYLDMNNLKFINDNIGHHAGDSALKRIGEELSLVARQSDVPARLGGDEFAIIFRHTGLADGCQIIENLRHRFSALPVNGENYTVSLAVGGACYPEEADNEEQLLKLADDRMYEAKRIMKQQQK